MFDSALTSKQDVTGGHNNYFLPEKWYLTEMVTSPEGINRHPIQTSHNTLLCVSVPLYIILPTESAPIVISDLPLNIVSVPGYCNIIYIKSNYRIL